jgi:Secretion system C-terminal sorting domain
MIKNTIKIFVVLVLIINTKIVKSQNIFAGEPVQIVGAFNGYTTTPYNTDYRTTAYRKLSTLITNPNDGRGQWKTTINIQPSGGDAMPITMNGGTSNGFLFISGPSTNRFANKWGFSNLGLGATDSYNNLTAFNSGEDMGFNLSTSGYYTFVMNDGGYNLDNGKYYVGYTSANPVSVTNNAVLVNSNGTATVSISTSANVSPEEKVYVRYTTGADFSAAGTSFIVQATGTGSSFSASIPAQALGSTVRYYVFTSTIPLALLTTYTEVEKSISVLNFDDNSKNNYTYSITTLPYKLSLFSGTKKSNSVLLNWKTDTELGVEKYNILRSEDGINFRIIGSINAENNNTAYSFTDYATSSKNTFYKLAIVEKDGAINFSKIITVSNAENAGLINVYPNPAKDFVKIELPSLEKGIYNMRIIDASGKMILLKTYTLQTGQQNISLLLDETFTAGNYFIILEGMNSSYKSSFIKN